MPGAADLRSFLWPLLFAFLCAHALPASAKCSALPVLSGTLDLVDAIDEAETLSPEQLKAAAARLRPLPLQLTSTEITERLGEFGLQRRAIAANNLAPKIALLTLVAETGDLRSTKAVIAAQQFRHALYQARDLTDTICGPEADSGWSEFAERIIRITGRGGLGDPSSGVFDVTRDLGLTLLPVVILALIAWYRIRKRERRNRASKRAACQIPVYVEDDGGPHALEIVDISQAGANIRNTLEWPNEQRITVQIEDLEMQATVRWSNMHFAGVQFDELIPRDQFKLLLSRYPPSDAKVGPKTKRGPETGAA